MFEENISFDEEPIFFKPYTVSGTGHRPNKLGGYNRNSPRNLELREELKDRIENDILNNGYHDYKFIEGGALGFDQMLGDVVLELRNKYDNIQLEVAVPFKQQDKIWRDDDKRYYRNQLYECDQVTYVDILDEYKFKNVKEGIYYPPKMQKRNEYMVDQCDEMISIFDGTKGGTYNCILYAKQQDKNINIINPRVP